jgi:allantoicase
VNLVNFKKRHANKNNIINTGDSALKEMFHSTDGWMDGWMT